MCLNRMMMGNCAVPHFIYVEAGKIVERQSTNILNIEDPHVASAIHYINRFSNRLLQVTDVANEVGLGRRTLERKFRLTLQKTVHEVITQSRINRLSKLLIDSDLSIQEIAYTMGFEHDNAVARQFKKHTGVTPSEYRAINKNSLKK
jgi:LacI family transcriptional regulator